MHTCICVLREMVCRGIGISHICIRIGICRQPSLTAGEDGACEASITLRRPLWCKRAAATMCSSLSSQILTPSVDSKHSHHNDGCPR